MDKERYSRQIMYPEWGEAGQEALGKAAVLVVGAGGLGSPLLAYLCSAGVGTLGIVDGDTVSLSNLPRQVLYTEAEIGRPKAECAAARLKALNGAVRIKTHNCFIDKENAEEIISGYDYVIDACDNFATRFLVNDCCIKLGKPYIYGSISGMCGQVSVFAVKDSQGRIRSYRELYDESEIKDMAKVAGNDGFVTMDKSVLPPAPGVIASVELAQLILLCGNFGEALVGRLWAIDLRTMFSSVIDF